MADSVPGLPANLGNAVDRCLDKDPARRFASGEEVADAVSVALASGREAPQPIRNFVKSASDLTQNLLWAGSFQAFFFLLGGLDAMTPEAVFRDVWLGFAVASLIAEPILAAGFIAKLRALLTSGYTRDDLLAVWNREIQLDEHERALEHGRTPGSIERASRWGAALGWTSMVASAAIGGTASSPAAFVLGLLGLATGAVGGMVSLWRYDGRTALSRRLTGKFLTSRFGRWVFGLAGLGLDRSALASLATHRSTERCIGMAVDSLFDALPKTMRQQLAELPLVVRHLEADATKIRQRVEQLNDVATKVDAGARYALGRKAAGGVIERRDALDRDLSAARDSAKQRLADAVTALETIRLDLLRLTAGTGSAGSLTADLSEARAVSEEVGRLLAAREEVEAQLSIGWRP
jgi:serine/threonine-protein kinase